MIEDAILIAHPGEVIVASQLNIPGTRNALGHVPGTFNAEGAVTRAVKDEGGDPDRAQDVPDIDIRVHPGQRHGGPRTGAA